MMVAQVRGVSLSITNVHGGSGDTELVAFGVEHGDSFEQSAVGGFAGDGGAELDELSDCDLNELMEFDRWNRSLATDSDVDVDPVLGGVWFRDP